MQINSKIVLNSLVLCTLMIGCGNSSPSSTSSDNNGQMDGQQQSGTEQDSNRTRFAAMTMNNQIIMQDTITNLEWVNGSGGCHPMVPGKTLMVAFNEAIDHCERLDFASHTDWRVPTIGEIQIFTVKMQEAGMVPFYQNPACPRV